jgi:pyruvate/2-oxoglutarate/acetoin dehydrogenase E1 component
MSAYYDELRRVMTALSEDPRTIFMGQSVACEGTAMRGTMVDVPGDKLLELPVFEDTQLGMALGMSLTGLLPICVYPRINFLLLAMSQLALHLDKLALYSRGGYRPRVIVRTAIGTDRPLDPGVQHLGNYADALSQMLSVVRVVRLDSAKMIEEQYHAATRREHSTVLVEDMGLYA